MVHENVTPGLATDEFGALLPVETFLLVSSSVSSFSRQEQSLMVEPCTPVNHPVSRKNKKTLQICSPFRVDQSCTRTDLAGGDDIERTCLKQGTSKATQSDPDDS